MSFKRAPVTLPSPSTSRNAALGQFSRLVVTAAVLLTLPGYATWASAQAGPGFIPVEGFLMDSKGEPMQGKKLPVVLKLYDRPENGTPLFEEETSITPVEGRFMIELGSASGALEPALFRNYPELYLGITIDGDSEAKPRMQLGAAAFAFEAAHAQSARTLAGTEVDELQSRVVGSCPDGQFMVGIADDATPACRADGGGDVTGVTVGKGLSGGGTSGEVNVSLLSAPPTLTNNFLGQHPTILSDVWTTVVSGSIEVPGPGHVLAIGVAHAISNVCGPDFYCTAEPMTAIAGLTASPDAVPFSRAFAATDGTIGMRTIPMTMTAAFAVSEPGKNTFYLRMMGGTGHGEIDFKASGSIQLIYLPGPVNP